MIDTDQTAKSASLAKKHSTEASNAGLERISALLGDLSRSPAGPAKPPGASDQLVQQENRFLAVRLGVAASLFYCLRGKHRQTADHSLRVALGCSAWAERLAVPADVRDRLEVAALLHDIGKIATPDRILRKPRHLTAEEKLTIDRAPAAACEILRGCCNDQALLNIIRFSRQWYGDQRNSAALSGDQLPLGARMLAIVESFDSMTTDQVYRRALSRERALAELFENAGTQFDPNLVRDYASMLEKSPEMMYGSIARRWLKELNEEKTNLQWNAGAAPNAQPGDSGVRSQELIFHQHLLETMQDGVIAIDREGTITHWNLAIERMTNVASSAVVGLSWSDEILHWYDSRNGRGDVTDYLLHCLTTSTPSRHRMRMVSPDESETPVKVNVIPVLDVHNSVQGALAIVQDVSEAESLERKVETLHEKATRDALTGVANRAEFDRMLDELVSMAATGEGAASIILCDIDKFKSVNDNHGHQAGDDVLVSFASVLSRHSRDGDLVARYGGEEFALLCPGCDNATAAKRAETIRKDLENTPHDALNGKCVTASFGVTQFQPGDNGDTMVARSDRALYKAKENGRNRVVQLGSGVVKQDYDSDSPKSIGWLSWLSRPSSSSNVSASLVTHVPVDLVVDKLRGYIADHDAEILSIEGQSIKLRVDVRWSNLGRRQEDLVTAFQVSLDLREEQVDGPDRVATEVRVSKTVIDVSVLPWRSRDRRGTEVVEASRNVISSVKSYLMADFVE